MTASEIRQKYLDFFKSKGHAIIPSASLIPENDPTVLFTTAGMHPLVPYLTGQPHPMGTRLADVQKCLRTDDIEEVGDNRHLTFFEMLGNWSLGDYFKQEAIQWSFELLTDMKWYALDANRLYVTVFEGDADAPRDEESIGIWQTQFKSAGIDATVGIAEKDEPASGNGPRIYAYPKKKNWWGPAGLTGPCGPDTEMFYDTGRAHDAAFGPICHPNCDCGRFVEIWNDVFMQYEKTADGKFIPLKQQNVDTGMGLERMACMLQGVSTVFDTTEFGKIMSAISTQSGKAYGSDANIDRSMRIIADHVRSATFIIGDPRGVAPSNVGQGYIVRRLLRRAVREGRRLGIQGSFIPHLAEVIIAEYGGFYGELQDNRERIMTEIAKEEEKFAKSIEKGMKELEKMLWGDSAQGLVAGGAPGATFTRDDSPLSPTSIREAPRPVTAEQAFILFSSYGFPLELTEELLKEQGQSVDRTVFEAEFKKHQDLSRTASAGTFKGGLADHSVETTRLHTATHLLHKALKTVLGDHVEQKGSNITAERLRFDFSHAQKMTPEELQKVEEVVNAAIKADYPVHFEVMDMDAAKSAGALGYFEDKYAQLGGKIKVYMVGDDAKGYYSKEICGGPHVEHTGMLGSFKIQKEEAVSAGVRRIKATVTGQ
jgi:alanyl-tRNA synthetase